MIYSLLVGLLFHIASTGLICRILIHYSFFLLEKFYFLFFVLTITKSSCPAPLRIPRIQIESIHLDRFSFFTLEFRLDFGNSGLVSLPIEVHFWRTVLRNTQIAIAQSTSGQISFKASFGGVCWRFQVHLFIILLILLGFLVGIFRNHLICIKREIWLRISGSDLLEIGRVFGKLRTHLISIGGFSVIHISVERGTSWIAVFFWVSRFLHRFWHIWVFILMMSAFKCRRGGFFSTIQLRRLTFLISIIRNTGHESSTRFCIHVPKRIWRSIWGNVWTWSLRVRDLVFRGGWALLCQRWWLIFLGGSSWRAWARFHNIYRLSSKTIASSICPFFAFFTLHSLLGLFCFCSSFCCQNLGDSFPVSRDYNLTVRV